ncbi:hypothetical protein HaLaN_01218 [Haematococcus lacustris]|uniref:Uncharacterized protein n=1 Tax=Haematococcus lacustris TaxID=44745 RepID=A0A699Y8R9_HAELA|nr:hypothetical protein HaLaN_01218 [Haematococcus lacustris]
MPVAPSQPNAARISRKDAEIEPLTVITVHTWNGPHIKTPHSQEPEPNWVCIQMVTPAIGCTPDKLRPEVFLGVAICTAPVGATCSPLPAGG